MSVHHSYTRMRLFHFIVLNYLCAINVKATYVHDVIDYDHVRFDVKVISPRKIPLYKLSF